ncbi:MULTISPECIES: hypothetical protein [Shewanella]|jgi:hypothetical protein|uniref:Uncharacterized protein n=3 Tax=Shewanella putrefaciens TaxID=24 RepID=E6XLB2_SHEP2|nr:MULTISPECIES: hypothetical protein [Shewanella]CAD6364538.1 hypothetical protein SHEWT2_02233 [Shewanella hafniensis]ABM24821.1 conserved hypothetical protein [Shewanella sp. W3-18-1]AVV82268.1 hypothetical protein SPWS13_0427 [Shewanella putrefaciens]MCA1896681.1 hypothetical protein [Shewanella putrefaciens]MCK7629326.1 hypothetical protein [Shewanella sp. JNE9-1]
MAEDRKIAVLCRIEPGCLGPDGKDHIEAFCALAQKAMQHFDVDVGTWLLTPRYDKTLDEMQYSVANKLLSRTQASKYFHLIGRDIEVFEERFENKLASLINLYLARK